MLASVSQHQRQKNAEQTKNRMKARVSNGYWVFNPPVGYRFANVSGHSGKVLVRDEPAASVIQEALEGFASGRFGSQTEVLRFLDNSPHYPKPPAGTVTIENVKNLLQKVIYSGHIAVPNWNVSLRPAKHEALISLENWQRIQELLKGKTRVAARTDTRHDFPLRGVLSCGCCGEYMTGYWAKGRSARYPYICAIAKAANNPANPFAGKRSKASLRKSWKAYVCRTRFSPSLSICSRRYGKTG